MQSQSSFQLLNLPVHDYKEQTSTASNGLVLLFLLITLSVELSRPALWHSRMHNLYVK